MIGDPQKVGSKYIYQNMSDEERRILGEEKRQRIKAEKENVRLIQEQKTAERRQQTEEEKRQQEEKRKMEEERKNKVAEITKVEFLDKDGKEKNVFETGEDMSIRIYFKKKKDIPAINFGIALFNQENNYIFGINTIIDKIDAKKYIERGYFQVDYADTPLKTNTYFIRSAIFGENDSIAYDFLERSKTFKVVSRNENQGLVELDYKWN
jgi:hypothetical protein